MSKPARTKEQWRAALLAAGVPQSFISKIEMFHGNRGADPWPGLHLLDTENDDLFEAEIRDRADLDHELTAKNIVPVFFRGSTFVAIVVDGPGRSRFVRISREAWHEDYGSDFRAVIIDLVIDLWEAEKPDATLGEFAESGGFHEWRALIAEIQHTDRSTFELDDAWRAAFIPKLLASTS